MKKHTQLTFCCSAAVVGIVAVAAGAVTVSTMNLAGAVTVISAMAGILFLLVNPPA